MTPVAWAQLIGESALKGCFLLLVGGALSLVLYRRSAAVRHAVWTTAIIGVLLIAPLTLLLPAIRVNPPDVLTGTLARLSYPQSAIEGAPPVRTRGTPHSMAAPPTPTARVSLPSILLGVWAVAAIFLSCCFLAAGLRLARIVRQSSAVAEPAVDELALSAARQLGVAPGRVRLRWADREFTPMTWGLRRPVLVLPSVCKTWDEERLRQVLVHELGHVQRWDVLTQGLSSAACALYWFNPLVWIAARQMLVERERACDDLVLQSGAKPSSYAHELLEIARSFGARWTAARVSPAMARRSQISGRLLAVLDPGRSRQGLGRRAALLTALVGIALVLPLAVLQPVTAMRAATVAEGQTVDTSASGIAAEDFKAIGAIYDEWKDAVRRRDARAVALFYTADGMIVTAGRPPVRGRQAVADLWQYYFDTGLAGIEVHPQEMYTVDGMICELGSSDALTSNGAVLSTSRYMTLYKKEEGQWRILRDFYE